MYCNFYIILDEEFFKTGLKKPLSELYNVAMVLEIGDFYDEKMKNYCIPLVLRIPRLCFLPIKDLQDLKFVYKSMHINFRF